MDRSKKLPDETIFEKVGSHPLDWKKIYDESYWINDYTGFESLHHFVVGEAKHERALVEELMDKNSLTEEKAILELAKQGLIFGVEDLRIDISRQRLLEREILPSSSNWEKGMGQYIAQVFNSEIYKPKIISVKITDPGLNYLRNSSASKIKESFDDCNKDRNFFADGFSYFLTTPRESEPDMSLNLSYNILK